MRDLVLFDYLDFEVVEGDFFYKIVLIKTGFAVTFKFTDRGVQPDGFAQIKFIADFVKCVKNFVCPRIFPIILNDCVAQHVIIFPDFPPNSHGFDTPVDFVFLRFAVLADSFSELFSALDSLSVSDAFSVSVAWYSVMLLAEILSLFIK